MTFARRLYRAGAVASALALLAWSLPLAVLAATIQTDLFVYQNGDTVTVTGQGFGAAETVDVVTSDPVGAVVDRGTAPADGQGQFTYQFALAVTVGGLYTVTATGEQSAASASTQFDPPPSPPGNLRFRDERSAGGPVRLSWDTAASSTDCYFVYRSTSPFTITATPSDTATCSMPHSSHGVAALAMVLKPATTYVDGGAPAGGLYYVVTALKTGNNQGESAGSGQVTTDSFNAGSGSDSRNFGNVVVGTPSVFHATYTNNGLVSFTVVAFAKSGANTGDFVISNLSPAAGSTVAAGASLTFDVTFTPGALGARSADIEINGRDSGQSSGVFNTHVMPVSGNGVSATGLVANSASGTYGGTTTLLATLTSGGSGLAGKTITFTLNGAAAASAVTDASGVATVPAGLTGINAATYPTGVGAKFAGDSSFAAASATASLTVDQKQVIPSVTVNSRPYDGTTTATVATCTLSGVIGADDVSCDLSTASANFADKNVGNGKTVTVTGLSLTGAKAGNYVLTTTSATALANISSRGLTLNFTAQNKVYDTTTSATITGCTLVGVVDSESVTCDSGGATAHFLDKNAGSGKTVVGSGFALSGSGAANYAITTVNNGSANITPRDLTVSAAGNNKVYDGNTNATATLSTDKLAGDDVTPNYTGASFADKNVGDGKTITVSGIAISGADAGNYNLTNTTAATSGNITRLGAVIHFTATSRAYDGTTAASITGCSVSGGVAGDDVHCDSSAATASFGDKNVGGGKTVTGAGFALSGTDADNYSFTVATTTANITARDLHVNAAGHNKTYDSTTDATVTLTTDKVSGDDVSAEYTAAVFADKNAGSGKLVTVSGIAISGADASNYHLVSTSTTTSADIDQRHLTVSATGVDRVYDGTTHATVNLTTDAIGGDDVTPHYASASFADKNVGAGKSVFVSGITITGADAPNYLLLNSTAATTAGINPRDLTVSATADSKVYDGTAGAVAHLSTDAVAGDDVTADYVSASFGDKNVGTAKTVTVGGISISGGDAGNYNLVNTTAFTTANITPRDLTVTAIGIDKTYDGTNSATVDLSTDKLAGDYVVASYGSAAFGDKNVGTGKPVHVTGITIWGADAANYHLVNTTADTTAGISARSLHVTAIGIDKTYDGTTDAVVTLNTDKVAFDNVDAHYASAAFENKKAGSDKAVTVYGISITGADAGNYILINTVATTAADINQRDLTVTASGVDKVYDGTRNAAVNLATDAISGDEVDPHYASASFADKYVGNGKAISVTGINITGGDAANYHLLNETAETSASITRLGLELYFTAQSRTYDGTDHASILTCSVVGIEGDAVNCDHGAATATFSDKKVGTGKTVTGVGFALTGADAGNYSLHANTTLADISARDLTVSATADNKAYDGTTAAVAHLSTDALADDSVSVSYTGASFADRNAGTGKTVTVSGISISGTDSANYKLTNTTATASASVTARPITVNADAKTKILGAADPAFTYAIGSGSLAPGDVWTGSLSRVAGEAVGPYPITLGTVNVADGNSGNNYAITFNSAMLTIVYATTGLCNGEQGHVILQPINADGSSVFKQGSTVPAKFRVCDLYGNSIGPNADGSSIVRSFTLTNVTRGAGSTNESIASTTPDTAFRWDPTAKQWIFNISTKNLTAGNTYQYTITLNDGSTIVFKFGLR